jgi:hypothetical protein
MDEYTRECLAIEVARSIGAEQVVETLKWLVLTRGTAEHIRSDNGPEFIAKAVRGWNAIPALEQAGCATICITGAQRPGQRVREPVYRELHREAAGRVPEPQGLRRPVGGAGRDRGLATRAQHGTPA